jgi:hypothetical protein
MSPGKANLEAAARAVDGSRLSFVTVMRRSTSRVGSLVLLPYFTEHLLPELHHRYVM